mgnify:CR=1 FL=1
MKTNRQVKPMNELPFDLNHNFVSKRNSSAMKQTIKKFSSTFAHHRKWQRLERLPKTNSSTSSSPKIQVDIVCRLVSVNPCLISTNVSSTLIQISFFCNSSSRWSSMHYIHCHNPSEFSSTCSYKWHIYEFFINFNLRRFRK